jgi:hypothetical protein
MAIPEEMLGGWARQRAVEASKRTHEAVRAALDVYSWPPDYSYTVYLQGSYRNYTNTRDDSDVDLVAELNSSFSPDLSILSQPEQAAFRELYSDPQDDWSEFRQHVLIALIGWFGTSAVRGDMKAIRVLGDSDRLNANVLVCQQCRIYTDFRSQSSERYVAGVRFQDLITERWIDNFPKAHIVNGEDKDTFDSTHHWYKPTVRMFKNARTFLIDKGDISDGLAPSYFIEGLLYNVPDIEFGDSHALPFVNCVKCLHRADFDGFSCQNELVRLFGPTPEQWDQPKAREFVDELVRLWRRRRWR